MTMTLYAVIMLIFLLPTAVLGIEGTIKSNKTSNTPNQDNDILKLFSYKLESYTKTLNQIDASVQNLQEKSHSWVIFRHHIEAWNSQMQSLEQKLDAMQRRQDDKNGFGAKLTSLEFSLNHILSKVALMIDKCQSNNNGLVYNLELDERQSLIKEFEKATGAFKRAQNEASARLNNILRYVHNLEHRTMGKVKSENVTLFDVERYMLNWEQKLITVRNVAPKEIKSLQEQTKKHTKYLEIVTKMVANIQKKLMQWHDNAENNVNYMTKQCQSATKELSTFTESSDLLLKRIEYLVLDLYEKFNSLQTAGTKVLSNEEANKELFEQTTTVEHDNDSKELNFIYPSKEHCHEVEQRIDGIYYFQKPLLNEVHRNFYERLCVFPETGAAWTVIQNRGPYVEQQNFNRSWLDYRLGFGDLHKDFWFGNEFTHSLISEKDYELRIEMEDFAGDTAWAQYSIFRIGSKDHNYNLEIGDYIGTAGDAMKYHNEMDFSTFDRRNDHSMLECCSCATLFGGGWWYDSCAESSLNGIYVEEPKIREELGIIWKSWRGNNTLKKVRMMIRPKNLNDVEGSTEIYNDDS